MVRILPEAYEDLSRLDASHMVFGGKEPFPSDVVLDKIGLLDSYPLIGPLHPDAYLVRRGFRKLIAGRWVVTYRVDDGEPTIYRVFRQRSVH